MGKTETKDLLEYLKPFDDDIKKIALWLRGFVRDISPVKKRPGIILKKKKK